MGGNKCNYKYRNINESFEVEAFMFGHEPYPYWFREAMYEHHTVRVHYNNTRQKKLKRSVLYADLNVDDDIPFRAYPYDMIINNLIPNKIVSLPYEVFERLFIQ